jgi:hypothetical protein
MDNIEYLQLRGFIDIPSVRPYQANWLVSQLDEILLKDLELNEIDKKMVSYFHPLVIKDPDFSYFIHAAGEYQTKPELYYAFLDERFGGVVTKNISFSHGLRIRRANELDTLGPRSWKNFQVYLHEGFFQFSSQKIQVSIGRRNFLLATGDTNSLLLSPDMHGHGYDGLYLFIPSRYYEFFTVFTVLDAQQNRYLAVHRIGLNLENFLKLGFSEAILFAGSLEPIYLNFLLPYYLAQWGSYRNDNIMWSLDAQLRIFHSLISAEFLIDDYMYEDDPYPNKLAFKLGFKSLLFEKFFVKLNYTFVDKWVYTHKRFINTYQHKDSPLGFPLGNDVDELSFSVKFMNAYGILPHLFVNYIRKGEGSIFLSYEEEGGTWNPPFPSGIVEKQFEIRAGIDYTLKVNMYISTSIGRRSWTNYGHVSGDDRDETVFDASLWIVL